MRVNCPPEVAILTLERRGLRGLPTVGRWTPGDALRDGHRLKEPAFELLPFSRPRYMEILDKVVGGLDADGEMAAGERQHKLIEVAVPNQHELQPATIDLPSLARERQQRRVDEQLLVLIRLTRAGLGQARALRGPELTIAVDCDVADVGGKGKDPLDQVLPLDHMAGRLIELAGGERT